MRNVDTALNPVLQFVQNGVVVFSAPIGSGTFNQALFLPGEYQLRVLYDTNDDGIWTPGNFFDIKRQPELVRPIERRITLKPNWDNDFDIQL